MQCYIVQKYAKIARHNEKKVYLSSEKLWLDEKVQERGPVKNTAV